MDGGADTSVIGEGWVIEHYTMRKAKVVGFDEKASKGGLPIVSGLTVTKLKTGEEVILWAHEAVYNDTGVILLSTYQMREFGLDVDDKAKHHEGKSAITVDEETIVPLQTRGALSTFKFRQPTQEDYDNLRVVNITQDDIWIPSNKNGPEWEDEEELGGEVLEEVVVQANLMR